jgi:hypothetical protein
MATAITPSAIAHALWRVGFDAQAVRTACRSRVARFRALVAGLPPVWQS